MLFCQHGSTDSGLVIGKLETDALGFDVVNEYIPNQGDNFQNTTFVVMDLHNHETWLLEDEWIKFNVIRCNGSTYRPNIIVANCNYKRGFFDDYINIIKYKKRSVSPIPNKMIF